MLRNSAQIAELEDELRLTAVGSVHAESAAAEAVQELQVCVCMCVCVGVCVFVVVCVRVRACA